jgi:hypothetical protein
MIDQTRLIINAGIVTREWMRCRNIHDTHTMISTELAALLDDLFIQITETNSPNYKPFAGLG